MLDCDGKKVHEGELITIVNRPDLVLTEYWSIFDFIEATSDFVLRNCITNEIVVLSQSNIKRTY